MWEVSAICIGILGGKVNPDNYVARCHATQNYGHPDNLDKILRLAVDGAISLGQPDAADQDPNAATRPDFNTAQALQPMALGRLAASAEQSLWLPNRARCGESLVPVHRSPLLPEIGPSQSEFPSHI